MISFFNFVITSFRFVFAWFVIILQLPVIFCLPKGKISVFYMSFFMKLVMFIAGIKVKVNGVISNKRPLLVVSNHISVFELPAFSVAFKGSFFAKKELSKFPLVGWISKKFGVIFLDRNPMHVMEASKTFETQMKKASYPMFIFPEGTTTNGAYVKQFKSSLFHFMERSEVIIQPVCITYKYKDGNLIDKNTLAEDFAYFDNAKQDIGPFCTKERSWVAQVFHVIKLGGFLIEITVLKDRIYFDRDRKFIAKDLHESVSSNYKKIVKGF